MTVGLVVSAAVMGLLIGSFLNVVIHRVPLGLSVVRPASRCPGCRHELRRRDNVPVLSWVLLRGQCRDCAQPISVRYPLVELGTSILFAVVAGIVGPTAALPAYLYLAAIAVALALIDLDVQRLPDAIVKPSYPVALLLLTVASWGTGDWTALVRALVGGLSLWGLYFLTVVAMPKGMGWGDVKLAGVLGLYLGWWGWDALAVGAFAGFVIGGLVGGVVMLRGANLKARIPFGPSMLAGALLALVIAGPVASWYLDVVGIAPSV